MDKYTATELAFKHGYEKGYEAGKKFATDNKVGDKWIPVSERLPNLYETVIVCDVREQYVGAWMYYGNGDWLHDDKLFDTEDITHWMPLPEPPKEGE